MTLLTAYLKRERLSQAEFARSIGVTSAIVCMWVAGKRRPGLTSALAIERVTRGEVPAKSWTRGHCA